MQQETWIIVANSSRARIFRVQSREALEELDGLIHAESRLREGELVSDRVGRSYDSVGGGRHGMEQETSRHKTEAIKFAADVATHLHEAWDAGHFKRLYLMAGPAFLGLLRQKLNSHMSAIVVGEIDKDLTELTPVKIREHLPYVP